MHTPFSSWTIFAALLAASCGGSPGTTDAAVSGDGQRDGAGYSCPAAIPAGSCVRTQVPHTCWYGNDPRFFCRTNARCDATQGAWTVTLPVAGCEGAPPAHCPADPSSPGVVCSADAGSPDGCAYSDRYCACSFSGGPRMVWMCTGPLPKDCPSVPPDEGDPCTPPSAPCGYSTGCGTALRCENGRWHWELLACM
jgi:hypothetical protein